jgi:hypothetical protein
MCHHRCGGILDGGVMFVVKYGQLSTNSHQTLVFIETKTKNTKQLNTNLESIQCSKFETTYTSHIRVNF